MLATATAIMRDREQDSIIATHSKTGTSEQEL